MVVGSGSGVVTWGGVVLTALPLRSGVVLSGVVLIVGGVVWFLVVWCTAGVVWRALDGVQHTRQGQ